MGLEYTKKSWSSLSQLVSRIEADKKEKIKEYDGMFVITNKYTYGLVLGKLQVYDKKKQHLNPSADEK